MSLPLSLSGSWNLSLPMQEKSRLSHTLDSGACNCFAPLVLDGQRYTFHLHQHKRIFNCSSWLFKSAWFWLFIIDMGGLAGSLARVNKCSKKHCRILFWKMRAALKKAVENGGKRRFRFQYDPSSYALNFDDGSCQFGEKVAGFYQGNNKVQNCYAGSTWIYVIWVES